MNTQKLIKITLAILFLLCLFKMPYGFYMLVRFVALVGFCILALSAYDKNRANEIIIYIALALLFQPFLKIPLGRDLWNIVDAIVAAGLLLSLYEQKKK